ncbi:hypothetical protein TI05_15715 [Achromatium sp. WMS3]|nr:hypothetical protein TI05_15715 [Achromatium sp. WMS3]KOR29349.1 hypothetical protein TI03_02515 [Achromatium sp. WMS1]
MLYRNAILPTLIMVVIGSNNLVYSKPVQTADNTNNTVKTGKFFSRRFSFRPPDRGAASHNSIGGGTRGDTSKNTRTAPPVNTVTPHNFDNFNREFGL